MSRITTRLLDTRVACLAALLLTGCGGDGGPTGHQAAPYLQYPTPGTYTVGQAISPLTPTSNVAISSYTVTPAMADLDFNATTGSISGTPGYALPPTKYTITGATAAGTVQATVTITVNDVKPVIAYNARAYSFAVGMSNLEATPLRSGGAVVSWSVSPALPAGLTISQSSGVISGTPTAASPTAPYTVTATNSGGQATANISLTVSTPQLLLDTGLSASVVAIRSNGSEIVSLQSDGTWLLQALPSGTTITRAGTFCGASGQCSNSGDGGHAPVDLAGNSLIDALSTDGKTVSGVEFRSAANGAVVATVSGSFSWYYLSTDGSYVCTADGSSLSAWSTSSGALLASSPGNYTSAAVFCAPGEMLVANGPAGANVIQTISVTTGTSSTSAPFQGTFVAWFDDGSDFISNAGAVVWIYTSAAAAVEGPITLATAPTAGWGNYFWSFTNGVPDTLTVYEIGSGATPALAQTAGSSASLFQSGSTIGVLTSQPGEVMVVDLSGAIAEQTYTVPAGSLQSYGAEGTEWFVGNQSGVVYDDATQSDLTLGAVQSVAGGTSNFSVATANGQIRSYDSSSLALANTLDDFAAWQLLASASGTVMLASPASGLLATPPADTIVFQPASGSTLSSAATGPEISAGLSSGGTVFGVSPTSSCEALLQQAGGAEVLCTTAANSGPVQLSPDGSVAALGMNTTASGSSPTAENYSTNLYTNGTLTTAVPKSSPIVWLDDNDVLLATYVDGCGNIPCPQIQSIAIYNATGNQVSNVILPCVVLQDLLPAAVACLQAPQVLTSSEVYLPDLTSVLSLPSAATLWQGPAAAGITTSGVATSAIAGSQYVFVVGPQVFTVPYPGP